MLNFPYRRRHSLIGRGTPGRPRPQGRADRRVIDRFAETFVGLDLGQASDYTALVAVRRAGNGYEVPLMARTRGRSYPAIVQRVTSFLEIPALGNAQLVLDATGVGRPITDLFRAADLAPIAINITAGNRVTGRPALAGVPKRDLITALVVAFQSGRIRIAAGLQLADALISELLAMRLRITAAGHDQYGAWRDGEHDDLVLALALGVWCAERWPRQGSAEPVQHDPAPPPSDPLRGDNDALIGRLDGLSARRPLRP